MSLTRPLIIPLLYFKEKKRSLRCRQCGDVPVLDLGMRDAFSARSVRVHLLHMPHIHLCLFAGGWMQ